MGALALEQHVHGALGARARGGQSGAAGIRPGVAESGPSSDEGRIDGMLVRQAIGGDTMAHSRLVDRHRPRIRRLIRSRVANPEDAEDIEQDVFVRACLAMGKLADPECFGPWVTQIAYNACVDYMRRRSRRRTVSLDEPVEVNGESVLREFPDARYAPEPTVQATELKVAFRQALGSLTEPSREAFMLRHALGLSMEEIADQTDGSVGGAKSLIYRARRKLEESLAPLLAS